VSSRPLAETRRTSSFPCTMSADARIPRSPGGCSFLVRWLQRGREIQRGQSETTALSPWRPNQSKCDIYGEKKSWQIVMRSHAVAGRPAPAWQHWIINHACLPVCITHVILIVMVIYYEPWLVNLLEKKRMEGKDYY